MDPITIITGTALQDLIDDMASGRIHTLRIHQAPDGSGVKIKLNEGMWTPWIGESNG
jgi:hypothetical protein